MRLNQPYQGFPFPGTLAPTGIPLGMNQQLPMNHPGRALLNYLMSNMLGPKMAGGLGLQEPSEESSWDNRVPGRVQPGIYAEPNREWTMAEIDAYHGGGKFSKFSDEFMKTGTGGHVFGWGHYVSEEKGVGKYYHDLYAKEKGSLIPEKLLVNGKEYTGGNDVTRNILRKEGDFDSAIAVTTSEIDRISGRAGTSLASEADTLLVDRFKSARATLQGLKDSGASVKVIPKEVVKGAAAQYKVKLFKGKDPSEYNFLDWDKVVSPENRQKIIKQLGNEGIIDPVAATEYVDAQKRLFEIVKKASKLKEGSPEYVRYTEELTGLSNIMEKHKGIIPDVLTKHSGGKDVYETLARISFPRSAAMGGTGKEASSKFLNRAGIDGIRYPTGTLSQKGFKDAGKKSNYVIFDPKNIEIMEGPGKNVKFNVGFKQKVKPESIRDAVMKELNDIIKH